MRYWMVVFLALGLTACNKTSPTHGESGAESSAHAPADAEEAAPDSIVEFLLAAAAGDFHAHRPPDPVQFRDVRIGRLVTPDGKAQYLMCGQFLPAQGGSNAEWMSFGTIKTSGYEQYIGAQAVAFCQNSSVTWEKAEDLSSMLKSRLDSLK